MLRFYCSERLPWLHLDIQEGSCYIFMYISWNVTRLSEPHILPYKGIIREMRYRLKSKKTSKEIWTSPRDISRSWLINLCRAVWYSAGHGSLFYSYKNWFGSYIKETYRKYNIPVINFNIFELFFVLYFS